MQDLRWALLIIGGVIVLGIYFLSLRNARRRDDDDVQAEELPPFSPQAPEADPAELEPQSQYQEEGQELAPADESVHAELASMSAMLADEEPRRSKPAPGRNERYYVPEDDAVVEPVEQRQKAVKTGHSEWSLDMPEPELEPTPAPTPTPAHEPEPVAEQPAYDEPVQESEPSAGKKPSKKPHQEPDPSDPLAASTTQHELDFSPESKPAPKKRKGWKLFGGKSEPEPEPEKLPDLLLVVYVVAPPTEAFVGAEIQYALENAGMTHGSMDIYHRVPHGGTDRDAIFSVADMLEPGTLGAEHLKEHVTPGLTMFLQLPGSVEGQAALDDMLSVAREVARHLGGEIRDERRSVLTRQTVEHMRERIIEHRRQLELAQRRAHGIPK